MPFDLIVLLAAIAVSLAYTYWRKFSLGRLLDGTSSEAGESSASATILAYYSAGHELIAGGHGTKSGMKYTLYATMPQKQSTVQALPYVDESAAIYVLELPFNTESHIVGLSKDHGLNRLQFESFLRANGMEKVVLEGDFPKYSDIYAAKGQQFQVRYVLDPAAMAYVADYCRSHFWEINNAELYIVVTNQDKEDVSVIEQSQKFIEQIKPALLPGQPGAPVVHHDLPYGEYDESALLCPICQKTMILNDTWQACPGGHGILIRARDLVRLHNKELKILAAPGKDAPHGPLTCPNCHHSMTSVDYEGSTALKIDTCEHCPFRWLDASEVSLSVLPHAGRS